MKVLVYQFNIWIVFVLITYSNLFICSTHVLWLLCGATNLKKFNVLFIRHSYHVLVVRSKFICLFVG
jgi:hypothetical protein